ncbi:hypothetical protein GGI1_05281 [Acidithiobacillus sp. GGI-221]|nr:hypothetical protein GGI1_05281 [Acidithiobacillus sp. GGI-221]
MLRYIHGERGFSHTRTARDNNELARVEAGGFLVQIGKARGQPRDALPLAGDGLDPVDNRRKCILELLEAFTGSLLSFGEMKDPAFGLVQQGLSLPPFRAVGKLGNFPTDPNEVTQGGPLPHDPQASTLAAEGVSLASMRRYCTPPTSASCS